MANDKLRSDDLRLEPLDLSNLDDIFDEPGEEKNPSAVTRFLSGYKRGFLEQTKARTIIRSFMRTALPDGLSRTIGLADDSLQTLKQIGADLEEKHFEELDLITSKVQDQLPKLKGRTSEKLYAKLEESARRRRETYAQVREYSADPKVAAEQRARERDEALIREALDGEGNVQVELAVAQEEAAADRFATDMEHRSLRDQIAKDRFDVMGRALSSLVVSQQKQVAFQDQVTYRYQRKGLELQMRSFMALRDLRKMAEVQMQMHHKAYEALVKNTGIPDHLKDKRAAQYGDQRRGGGGVGSRIFNSLPMLLGNFGSSVQKNATDVAGGAIQQLAQMLSMGEGVGGIAGNAIGNNKAGFAGDLAGRGTSMLLQRLLVPYAARKARPHITAASDRYTGGVHNKASYLMDNMAPFLQEFANDGSKSGGMSGMIQKMVQRLVPQFQLADDVENGNYQKIGEQAAFNQLTQRSIVEIIPGYLARILHSVRGIETGGDAGDMEVYDITRGEFTTKGTADKRLTKKIVSGNSTRNVSWSINSALDQYDSEGKLSTEARQALGERLLRDASTNRRFSADAYSSMEGYAAGTDDAVIKELSGFFKSKFRMGENGKMLNTADNNRRQNEYSQSFLNIRAMTQDPIKEINRLLDTGNIGALRGIGVVYTEENQDKINYDRLWALYREGVTDTNPYPQAPDDGGSPAGGGGDGAGDLFGDLKQAFNNARDKVARTDVAGGAQRAGAKVRGAMEAIRARMPEVPKGQLTELIRRMPEIPGEVKTELLRKVADIKAGGLIPLSQNQKQFWDLVEQATQAPRAMMPALPRVELQQIMLALPAPEGVNKTQLLARVDAAKTRGGALLTVIEGEFWETVEQAAALGLPNLSTPTLALAGPDGDSLKSRAKELAERMRGGLTSGAEALQSKVVDLYVNGKQDVAIKAADMQAGHLIDIATQKVIQTADDITGAVMDRKGQVILTLAEARSGLQNLAGRAMGAVSAFAERHGPLAGSFISRIQARLLGSLTEENGAISRVKDLYIDKLEEPVLLARDMAKGLYVDVNTGNVIESVDDITGAISDGQSIVVTAEEAAEGFTDNTGKRITPSKLLGMAGRLLRTALSPAALAFKAARGVGKAAMDVAMLFGKALLTLDAYLPGTKAPVLSSKKLKRGEYYSHEGRVLTSFDDLRDGVYDVNGQVVVSEEDVPNLVNRDGSTHTAAKRRSWLRKTAKSAIKGAIGGPIKAYAKATKAYYGFLGRKLFGRKINPATGKAEEVVDESKLQSPTDTLLSRILTALKDGLPGKGPAKGSWQAQLAAEENEDAEKRNADKAARADRLAPKGAMARLMDFFKGRNKADEDDGEDEGSDVNIDLGDRVERDGEGKGKGKKGRAKKPRGRFGRGWDRLGKSKLGRAGKFLGRGALGGLTMGAEALLGTGATAAIGSGLSAATGFLGAGLSGAAGLAGSAGAALAGLITAPVLLGVGAAAAVGAGGYWLYSRHRDTSGDFRSLRLLQYGIDSTSLGLKVLEAESILEGITSKNGTPTWTLNAKVAQQVLDVFGIDKSTPGKIGAMANWLEGRFKPVFFAYIQAMQKLAPGAMLLNEVDDKFPAEQKAALLQMVRVPAGADGPYGVRVSPDGDKDPLSVTPEQIEAKFAELKAKFAPDAAKTTTLATPNGGAAAVTTVAAGTAANAVGVFALPTASNPVLNAQNLMNNAGGSADKIGTLGAIAGSSVVAMSMFNGSMLSPLQSIRVRAYGLNTVDQKNVSALFSAEAYLYPNLSYDKAGKATWTGDAATLFNDIGPLFGVNATDPTDAERVKFTQWLYYRFAPTFMAFAGAVRGQDRSIASLDQIEQRLNAAQKVAVANAVLTAEATMGGEKLSVWTMKNFFGDSASADALKAMAKNDLAVLSAEAEKAKVATPTQSAASQGAQAKGGGTTTAEQVANTSGSSFMDRASAAATSFGASIKESFSDAWKGTKDFLGFGEKNGNAGAPYQAGKTPTYGGAVAAQGNVYDNFASGTGGMFEQIPLPKSNKSREAAMVTLKVVEAMTGIPAELLATFASIESGFDYLVKAATSSATGWFQFINDTWDGMVKKYGSKYGFPADPQRNLRKDPRANALMGAEFLKENYAYLSKALGRAPTDVDLYAAHFFGPGTAAKFLNSDPNSFSALAFPAQARANMSIFYKGPGAPRTMREIYSLFEEKVSKHRKGGKGTNILLQKPANTASPVAAADAQAAAVVANAAANDPIAPEPSATGTPASPAAPTLSQQASMTKAPLSMMPMGNSSTTAASTPSSGAAPQSTSVADPQPGDDAAVTAQKAANRADKLKAAQVAENMAASKAGLDIQQQQLAATLEMRDYLKVIAANMGVQGVGPQAGSNGISNPPAPVASKAVGNVPMPIKMSR